MMYNWCCPINTATSRLSKIVHSISIPLIFSFITFNTVFQGVQLAMEMLNRNNTVHAYITNITWFCTHPLSVFILVYFILKRDELWDFFNDWRLMESHIHSSSQQLNFRNVRTLKTLIVSFNWCMYGAITLVASCLILNRPEASYLLSHYGELRENLGLTFITVFHLLSVLSTFFSEPLSGAVPGFIFYHAAQILRLIQNEIEHHFTELTLNPLMFQTRMRQTFLRYQILSKMVKRANKLFGLLIIFNHATLLFMIVTLLYGIFYQLQRSHIDALIMFSGVLPYLYLLLLGHLLAAQLNSVSSRLRLTLSSGIALNSLQLSKEDVNVASIFLNHLKEHKLVVRPLSLYSVTHSSILTLFNIVIAYVIVLLQA